MRPFYVKDLKYVWSGDFELADNGDLKDTSGNRLQSFVQEVQTRLYADLYDWELQPHIGASLSELKGEPNDRDTAEAGKAMIIAALTKDGLCDKSAVQVRYSPVGRHNLLYRIKIVLPEASGTEIVDLSMLVDTVETEVMFL